MKKTFILVFLVACSALFVACTHRVTTDVPVPAAGTGALLDPVTDTSEPAQDVALENAFDTVHVRILPTSFEPAVVSLSQGQKVKFALESVEADSTFSVAAFGMQVSVSLDQPMVVDIPTTMTGSFAMVNALAGSGAVSGQIVIE